MRWRRGAGEDVRVEKDATLEQRGVEVLRRMARRPVLPEAGPVGATPDLGGGNSERRGSRLDGVAWTRSSQIRVDLVRKRTTIVVWRGGGWIRARRRWRRPDAGEME